MSKEYDYDFVIVEMATVHVYDFMIKGESVSEAEERGNKFYQEELKLVTSHFKNYGGEYWEDQVNSITKKVETGCKVMSYEQFKKAEREHLLDNELTEVTEDKFDDALNVLPPLKWCTINGIEMFCMCEMLTGTYTDQYARYNGKYYTKLVDIADKSTWINNYIKEVAVC